MILSITDQEFVRVQKLMYSKTGVMLKESKKPLIISRLRKRLDELKFTGLTPYLELLEKGVPQELEYFINAITTNETFLFRHPEQFKYLNEVIWPELKNEKRGKPIQIWSGACSSGEEPYSIAISFQEFFKGSALYPLKLFATDINSDVLEEAKRGVYEERSFREIPGELKEKYFKKVVQPEGRKIVEFEADAKLKSLIQFGQHNLKVPYARKEFDVIFLRNVLIYFDKASKQQVISLVEQNLRPGGYFLISLSETLSDVQSSLKLVRSCIYKKPGGV